MLKSLRTHLGRFVGRVRRLNLVYKLLLALLGFGLFMGGSVEVTGTTGFCNSCHVMEPFYESWQQSGHAQVNCLDCHIQPGVVEFAKGKMTGLAQAVDCMVGRVGTNPSATVYDRSCLRSGCHDTQTLREDSLQFGHVQFTHDHHIERTIDGLAMTCTTCHSHYEGDKHFSVKPETCFTCHFLKGGPGQERLVQTTCLSCHELPSEVIRRGTLTIDHQELLSYQASCDTSCHQRQIEQESVVAENSCLACHSYRKSDHVLASESLHQIHTANEKVECWGCHGAVPHGPTFSVEVAAMINCQDCHTGTHSIQRGIYTGDTQLTGQDSSPILGPMLMAHVGCKGCHIGQTEVQFGDVGSLGMVSKAVPQACDRCHLPGTGDQYIPFWQKQTKQLHTQVSEKIAKFRDYVESQQDPVLIEQLTQRVEQAQSLLDVVSSDGSWGVHNFKYTEAILNQAAALLSMSETSNGKL